MRWGDWVVAFGSPLKLDRTITAGVISCIDRTDVELRLPKLERTYFQSDCPTNPGSSGGPLVNLDCRVIGLNSMGMPIATGVGFSVPIDNVREHLELKNLWWDSPCQLTTSANI
ncbi:putative protease Do-like 14 [Arabidopsis lyrata subsp. lyrata]|nr:putative protease Do-like 14 [Arabidopsis lyrata subsp. lyrata]|eukprot:XP_020869386.1 putative protease Do-like 14 [Arabidopsis lyrata subsp. lyrata]